VENEDSLNALGSRPGSKAANERRPQGGGYRKSGTAFIAVAAGVSPAVQCYLQPAPDTAGKLRLPLQEKTPANYSCSVRTFISDAGTATRF
jgi:hypothetical protein